MDDHPEPPADHEREALPNPFDLSGIIGSADGSGLEGIEREEHPNRDETSRRPNFPPLCPVVSVRISSEIPPRRHRHVRTMFYAAVSFTLVLLFSVAVSFLSWPLSGDSVTSFQWWKELLMSLFYLAVFPAALFFCQFYPFYKSCRDDLPSRTARAVQPFVLLVHAAFLLGFPGTGMVGVVYAVASVGAGSTALTGAAAVATAWHAVNFLVQCAVTGFTATPGQEGALLVATV